jgi:predicted amidohydrolase
MSNTLNILGLQSDIIWENPSANRSAFEKRIRVVLTSNPEADILVLPECFTSGFTMNLESLDDWEDGETLEWMRKITAESNVALTGSIAFRFKDGVARNRSLFVKPDGSFDFYDKRHLFTLVGEDKHYKRGENAQIVEFRGWRILLQICYDLRFPTFSRNSAQNPYDIALYVANWPAVRSQPWRTLLQARAIENQCYVMGVNRTGVDATGIAYKGDGLGIDPYGNILCDPKLKSIVRLVCDRKSLEEYRAKFPVLRDAD